MRKYQSKLHRIYGVLLDLSLIWGLEHTFHGDLYVNGAKITSNCNLETYNELEEHFISYKIGENNDR